MPTYSYLCKDCRHAFDIVQSFSDDALITCPECTGTLRKKFGNVGVSFKGSGFYRNDARGSSTSSSDSSSTSASTSDSSSSSGGESGSSGGSSDSSSSSSSSGSGSSGSSSKAST